VISFGRFVLRLLLTATVFLTVGFVAAAVLSPALRYRPIDGLRIGVASGVTLATVLVALDYWRRRKVIRRYGLQPDYSARQQRTLIAPVSSPTRVLTRIEEGMADLLWLYPHSVTREGQTLRAVTKPSTLSFSENVSVSVSDADQNKVVVTIVSAPRSIGTIVDYGKGIENVEELRRAIETWLR
jgi:hypothetical protein